MTGRLLTAREVADRLGITRETALRWTRRGDLPGFKLPGGAIRYREPDLDAWLQEHATGAADRGVLTDPERAAPRTRPEGAATVEGANNPAARSTGGDNRGGSLDARDATRPRPTAPGSGRWQLRYRDEHGTYHSAGVLQNENGGARQLPRHDRPRAYAANPTGSPTSPSPS